eukprot:jgi/Orpsp1_1/1186871/evm.model.d7180000053803.1
MSVTGVKVDPLCVQYFNDLKMGHNFKYIVYAFNKDRSRIIVERTGVDKELSYREFIKTLPENECRYVVFNFDFEHSYMGTSITAKCERILLLLWCPCTARIRE